MYKLSYSLACSANKCPEKYSDNYVFRNTVFDSENPVEETVHKTTIPEDPVILGVFDGTGSKENAKKIAEIARKFDFDVKSEASFQSFLTKADRETGENGGIGSMALGVFEKNHLVFLTTGTSAVYRFQDGRLKKIGTKEFSLPGAKGDFVYRLVAVEPFEEDRFILATDGLMNSVTEADLQWVLEEVSETGSAADVLLKTAYKKEKSDSITVIAADILRAKWSIFSWK